MTTTTTPALRLRIPGRPMLSNDRLHWAQRARRTAAIKGDAKVLALAAVGRDRTPLRTPVTLHAWVVMPRRGRPVDVDACAPAAKAALDGIVSAGLLRDDGPRYLQGVTFLEPQRGDSWCLCVDVYEATEAASEGGTE